MNKIVLCGWMLALAAGGAAAKTPGAMLEQVLRPGAEVFDSRGQAIGIVTGLNLDGSVIVRDLHPSATGAGSTVRDVEHVLPFGAIRWTGHGLQADMSVADVGRLPTPDDVD